MVESDTYKLASLQSSWPEKLEIDTVTLGISLLDCSGRLPRTVRARTYDKIRRVGGNFVAAANNVAAHLGVATNRHHVRVTPVSLIMDGGSSSDFVALAGTLEEAASDIGVDSVSGFTALVANGMTRGDRALIESLPEVIRSTKHVFASIIHDERATSNQDAIELFERITSEMVANTTLSDGIRRLSAINVANVASLPFWQQYVDVTEGDATISVTVNASTSTKLIERLGFDPDRETVDLAKQRLADKLDRGAKLFAERTADVLSQLSGYHIGVANATLVID